MSNSGERSKRIKTGKNVKENKKEEGKENLEEIEFWSRDDIVTRFNENYHVNYEYRKLRDAFRKTLEELFETYEREYGEDCGDKFFYEGGEEEEWFEKLFKKRHAKMGEERYRFQKLCKNLTDSHGLLIDLSEDEELDELCQMYRLCLEFTNINNRTVRGMETLGLMLERRAGEQIFASGEKKLYRKGEVIYRAMQCCIIAHLDTLERAKEELKRLFKKLSKIDEAVRDASKFQENELGKVIARYNKDVIDEFRTWCVYSQSIAEMEQSRIRTYKPRGSDPEKEKTEKRNKSIQIININTNFPGSFEEYEKERIFLDLHENAYQIVQKRRRLKEESAGKWEDAMNEAWDEIEKLDEDMKKVLERAFLRELAVFREKAEAFLSVMLRGCLLERTRYWIQNDKKGTFGWNKDKGVFVLPDTEKEFQESLEPESKKSYMADAWAQINEDWKWR